MNFVGAIDFLQKLIYFEKGVLDNGRIDQGWCCNEHAVIASLALTHCGASIYLCSGSAVICGKSQKEANDIDPHGFVVTEYPAKGVFDTSVKYQRIKGIFPSCNTIYPSINIKIGDCKPSVGEFHREQVSCGKNMTIWYSVIKSSKPNQNTVFWDSDTLFGVWLSSIYGTKHGLWSKAAYFVSCMLNGEDVKIDGSRDSMWAMIAERAPVSANEQILSACEKMQKQP
jgi:hypothetical protein